MVELAEIISPQRAAATSSCQYIVTSIFTLEMPIHVLMSREYGVVAILEQVLEFVKVAVVRRCPKRMVQKYEGPTSILIVGQYAFEIAYLLWTNMPLDSIVRKQGDK